MTQVHPAIRPAIPETITWWIETVVTLPTRVRCRLRYHRERRAQDGALGAVRGFVTKSQALESAAEPMPWRK